MNNLNKSQWFPFFNNLQIVYYKNKAQQKVVNIISAYFAEKKVA